MDIGKIVKMPDDDYAYQDPDGSGSHWGPVGSTCIPAIGKPLKRGSERIARPREQKRRRDCRRRLGCLTGYLFLRNGTIIYPLVLLA